jgi:hypothetical protein
MTYVDILKSWHFSLIVIPGLMSSDSLGPSERRISTGRPAQLPPLDLDRRSETTAKGSRCSEKHSELPEHRKDPERERKASQIDMIDSQLMESLKNDVKCLEEQLEEDDRTEFNRNPEPPLEDFFQEERRNSRKQKEGIITPDSDFAEALGISRRRISAQQRLTRERSPNVMKL